MSDDDDRRAGGRWGCNGAVGDDDRDSVRSEGRADERGTILEKRCVLVDALCRAHNG